jgi:hypothetical protein
MESLSLLTAVVYAYCYQQFIHFSSSHLLYRFLVPTYKAGKKQDRSRNIQAAECMALAGASRLLTPYTLPSFD